jgi:hypothetical protein
MEASEDNKRGGGGRGLADSLTVSQVHEVSFDCRYF